MQQSTSAQRERIRPQGQAPSQSRSNTKRAEPKVRRVEYKRPWLYPIQERAIFNPVDSEGKPARYSLIEATTKGGKAQPLDAIVWTPDGPKRMGDIKLGELVLTPKGASLVSGIYPQGERPIYRFTFSDGTEVEADEEHLWDIRGYDHKPAIVTTKTMLSYSDSKLRGTWVPEMEVPAQFNSQPVPLDPYLLGILIGDGCLKYGISFSSKDEEIIEAVRLALPAGHYLRKEAGDNCDWNITAGKAGASKREDKTHIAGILGKLGLRVGSHEKFIPPEYRYNSVEVRRAVIQGIMDSDGWVDDKHQPSLDQTSERLAKDVAEVIQSLGGSVLTSSKTAGYKNKAGRYIPCKRVYCQALRLRDASWCFRLDRKAKKVKPRKKSPARHFRKIEFIGYKPAQCIEVFDFDHLYLTNGFITTHNTVGCIAWLYEQAYINNGIGRNFWWVAPVYGQARIAFRRLKNFLPPGQYEANKAELTITLRGPDGTFDTGATIWFKGSDNPDSLYGEDVWAAVIDEASRCKEESWFAIRSTITATRGPCRMIGNVKGRRNWFYKLARKAQAGTPGMGYYKITAADAVAAGVLAKEEIEGARNELPDAVFKELYDAEASDDQGNPFGIDWIQKCKVTHLSTLPVMCYGIDLAKKRDWTVIIGLDKNGKLAYFNRFQKPWEDTTDAIINLIGMTPALIDATGVGDPIVERVQKRCSNAQGFIFSQKSKQRVMEGLAVSIQRQETSVLEGIHESEMESFEYVYTRTGVMYSAPEGFTDDTVYAHALANQIKSTGPDLSIWEKLNGVSRKAA